MEYLNLPEGNKPKPFFKKIRASNDSSNLNRQSLESNINQVSMPVPQKRKMINPNYTHLCPKDKKLLISLMSHELYCGEEEPSDISYSKNKATLKFLHPFDRKDVIEGIKAGAKNEEHEGRAEKLVGMFGNNEENNEENEQMED